MKATIKEAVEYFNCNRDAIPVFAIRKGDYAFEISGKDCLYLVVEKNGTGIFVARLTPDLMRLKELTENEQKAAREFAHKQLTSAGLL
ncbi:MAG TPA: hypothetical protein EYP63_01395 [Desulfotomaculum sp.]|nr:hypothetical protein [Desulfotomaculum sp.]